MTRWYRSLFTVTMTAMLSMPAMAQSTNQNPYLQPDESWISVTGTVQDIQDDSFTLSYGQGMVTVEMDDWDWYSDTTGLREGDKVTVYGKVDDDLYQTTTIEASSVYVERLGTYFYANAADEEYDDDYDYWIAGSPIGVGETTLRGTVTTVNGREFTIDTGINELTVDTVNMAYNPLDDEGFQKIDPGDYVSVTGEMDRDFWEKRELMADAIVVLEDD